jgi:hypothetical protein
MPADDMPLGPDQLALDEAGDIAPQTLDVTGELVADDHRDRDVLLGPLVPFVDVEVGAADPRGVDPDQDIIRPGLGHRDVLESETVFIGMLYQCSHDAGSR